MVRTLRLRLQFNCQVVGLAPQQRPKVWPSIHCRSYGFISTSTKEQVLICFANQVNQTSANRLAVADVELICFVEFPCQVIAWQIVIEQVAECQAETATLIQKTISFLIDKKQTANCSFYRFWGTKQKFVHPLPPKKTDRKQIQKEAYIVPLFNYVNHTSCCVVQRGLTGITGRTRQMMCKK